MAERSVKMESGIRPSFSVFDYLLTVLHMLEETNSNRYYKLVINIELFRINYYRISETSILETIFIQEKRLQGKLFSKIKSFDNLFLHIMLKSIYFEKSYRAFIK